MGDMIVKPGPPHFPGHAAMPVNAGHHLRCHVLLCRQFRGAFPEPFFQRDLRHDPEDVRLVRVPQDLREKPRLRIQIFGQRELVVHPDRRLAEFRPSLRKAARRESFDQSLPEQKIGAELGMIHGLCVKKGAVPAHLLKAADVVQKAQKPRQIQQSSGHAETPGDPPAEVRDPERMLNF